MTQKLKKLNKGLKIIYAILMFVGAVMMLFIEKWWIGLAVLLFTGFFFIGGDE